MSTIGNKIRKIRELKNLKQDYMAEKLGISAAAYGKLERDETEIGVDRLEQIAKIFDLSIQDVLAFDEKMLFNFLSSASGCGYISHQVNNNGLIDSEKKLYEDKIHLLEDKINYLTKEIERLQK